MSNVAIIGASNNPARYSYQAQQLLIEKGHRPLPVSLHERAVQGVPAVTALSAIADRIDTITMYISPAHQTTVIDEILASKPRRVIFNPGSENPAAYAHLQQAGIAIEEACTLVLLRTRQF